MLLFIDDNEGLLQASASLRVDLEYLIYTIEQHRSRTGRRFVVARERFAGGLARFFTDAVIMEDEMDSSSNISPEPAPKTSTSVAGGKPDTPPTTVRSGMDQSEFHSDAHSTAEDKETKLVVESESLARVVDPQSNAIEQLEIAPEITPEIIDHISDDNRGSSLSQSVDTQQPEQSEQPEQSKVTEHDTDNNQDPAPLPLTQASHSASITPDFILPSSFWEHLPKQVEITGYDVSINRDSPPPPSIEAQQPKATRHDVNSNENLSLSPSIKNQKIVEKKPQSRTLPWSITMIPFLTDPPFEENRSLWIPEIPTQVTTSQIYSHICGGAVERVEPTPPRPNNSYGISITFIERSAAQKYLNYALSPQGKAKFPASGFWKHDILWNPRPLPMHFKVTVMARDPYVKARRCLVVKGFPVEIVPIETFVMILGKLGGNFSKFPRVMKIRINQEDREATIHTERVCCAVQLMEAKICGRWGEEFDHSTLEFGKDECDRPVPGTYRDSFGKIEDAATPEAQTSTDIADQKDPQYKLYRSHKHFSRMRALYISTLPSNTTISDLVAQIHGGPLERVTLTKRESGMLTGSIAFVHHSSARAWYEHTMTPAGRIRFQGAAWDWRVRWETSIRPIGRDMWHSIMNPSTRARRGFVIKNISSRQDITIESLKKDVLSQSNKMISFEKFEIDLKKHEARIIMASIGSAMGGITAIKRLQKYKGCRIEFLKDECENPIPLPSVVNGNQATTVVTDVDTTANDITVLTPGAVQPVCYNKTLYIRDLPGLTTLQQLSARIRGGALDSLRLQPYRRVSGCSVFITFLDNYAAENYLKYASSTTPKMDIVWGRDPVRPSEVIDNDARRVLTIRGFPSSAREASLKYIIQNAVKHAAWLLKMDQKNIIESINITRKQEIRLVLMSIKLAVKTKGELPKAWSVEYGRDECEGPLSEIGPAVAVTYWE